MVLLESMKISKNGILEGKMENGERIKLEVPVARSKTYKTSAAKERDITKAWNEDLKKFRNDLSDIARNDSEFYYHIPEKHCESTLYTVTFAYLTFKK
jgi:hypothetical protein